jgi:hypothetical protein
MAKNPTLTRRQCIEQMRKRAAELNARFPQQPEATKQTAAAKDG